MVDNFQEKLKQMKSKIELGLARTKFSDEL